MAVADLQIKTRVRSILTRHWIDLTRVGIDCCRGSVRFRGEISLAEGHRCSSPVALLDTLESEIKQIPGVKSVYLVGVTVTVASDSRAPLDENSPEESAGLELSVSDLELEGRVRAVLDKHRIDLSPVDFDCCKGTISFRGRICFVDGTELRDNSTPILEVLLVELKRIPGIRQVYFMGVKFGKAAKVRKAKHKGASDSVVVNCRGGRRRS